jgi:DNA-binding HxlR family transcriptional regulator
LIGGPVKAEESDFGQAGISALSLLATSNGFAILSMLEEGPRSLTDLRALLGFPPPTTIRGHVRSLVAEGVVEKRRHPGFPGSVDYRLTAAGSDLMATSERVNAWLAECPLGPIALGDRAAKRAIRALSDGWWTGIVHALASRPLCLTELDGLLAGLSYPALERRLSSMRRLGLLAPVPREQGRARFEIGDWLRAAVAPLIEAILWEHRWLHDRAPIARRDVEAVLLLILPALRLGNEASGACRLSVRTGEEDPAPGAGLVAVVREGSVAVVEIRDEDGADAWASGSSSAWLTAVTESEPANLARGGKTGLVNELVAGLHQELFGGIARDAGGETSPLESVLTH